MNKKTFKYVYTIVVIALMVIAIVTAIIAVVSISAPRQRTTKAQQYDFECVTAPKQAPLKECAK